MANKDKVIYDAASVYDVQQVLDTIQRSVPVLCKHHRINPCATYKPYNFGGLLPDGLTDAIRRANSYGIGFADVNVALPSSIDSSSDVSQYAPLWSQWSAPDGSDTQPCRLGDFLGYDHNSIRPIAKLDVYTSAGHGYTKPIINNKDGYGYIAADLVLQGRGRQSLCLSVLSRYDVPLSGMYLTLILGNHRQEFCEDVYVAQSRDNVIQGEASGILNVTLELSKITNMLVDFFGNTASFKNAVIVGLAPKIDGIEDVDGVPQLLTRSQLPPLVCLNIFGDDVNGARDNFSIITINDDYAIAGQEGGGEIVIPHYDVVGYLTDMGLTWSANSVNGAIDVGLDGFVRVNVDAEYSSAQLRLIATITATNKKDNGIYTAILQTDYTKGLATSELEFSNLSAVIDCPKGDYTCSIVIEPQLAYNTQTARFSLVDKPDTNGWRIALNSIDVTIV